MCGVWEHIFIYSYIIVIYYFATYLGICSTSALIFQSQRNQCQDPGAKETDAESPVSEPWPCTKWFSSGNLYNLFIEDKTNVSVYAFFIFE